MMRRVSGGLWRHQFRKPSGVIVSANVEDRLSVKVDAIPWSFILCIRSRETALRSISGVIGAVLLFVSIFVVH